MTTPERDLAKHMLSRILAEYGKVDNRLGREFHAIADGNPSVARECLLLMAEVKLLGAISLMAAAGRSPDQIAERLYQFADSAIGAQRR